MLPKHKYIFNSLSLPPSTPPVILEKPIRIPRSLSVKAASVLKGFLNKVSTVPALFLYLSIPLCISL